MELGGWQNAFQLAVMIKELRQSVEMLALPPVLAFNGYQNRTVVWKVEEMLLG